MSKATKTLLVLSVTCLALGLIFVTGLVNVQDAVALYVALPAGAIFFGLFLISKLLDSETAAYDAEQSGSRALAQCAARSKPEDSPARANPQIHGSLLASH